MDNPMPPPTTEGRCLWPGRVWGHFTEIGFTQTDWVSQPLKQGSQGEKDSAQQAGGAEECRGKMGVNLLPAR